ncbi:MAG TPA: hypothetical protein VFA81_06220 [Burkholderiales bacterium]|nr:hypothetical protein [Burkholderiales bacterium]
MKQHLTERAVKAMVPEIDRDILVYDDEVTGFAICVYRSGKRAFVLRYRIAGRARGPTSHAALEEDLSLCCRICAAMTPPSARLRLTQDPVRDVIQGAAHENPVIPSPFPTMPAR